MRLELGASLDTLKAAASSAVDTAAEAARLQFLTPGAGQMLEYQGTESDARAAKAAGYPDDLSPFPFVQAEANALSAMGQPMAVKDLVDMVIAQADAWRIAGSMIKELRRQAKLQIDAATTAAAIRAATAINWPTLPTATSSSFPIVGVAVSQSTATAVLTPGATVSDPIAGNAISEGTATGSLSAGTDPPTS